MERFHQHADDGSIQARVLRPRQLAQSVVQLLRYVAQRDLTHLSASIMSLGRVIVMQRRATRQIALLRPGTRCMRHHAAGEEARWPTRRLTWEQVYEN